MMIERLLSAAAYPHVVGRVELLETHAIIAKRNSA